MAKKKTTKKKASLSTAQKVGIGVGITAAAAAAAGAYFLYGDKNAKQNQKKVKSWVLKAKAEVLESLEKAEHMTQEEYEAVVDGVAMVYGKLQDVTKTELGSFEKEMKGHWDGIEKTGRPTKKVAKKATKKAAKKTVKKAVKKVTKKVARKTTKKV